MQYIIVFIVLASIAYASVTGNVQQLSSELLSGAGDAVTLVISICGVMCFWCGIMRVAEKAGITQLVARLLSPVIAFLFKGLRRDGSAARLISLNLTANLLGLGNASTPLGVKAMQAIAEEERVTDTASNNMVMLAVLNTASLQIIPSTMAALRLAQGASRPMDVLPCVWIVSAYSIVVAVSAAKLLGDKK